MTTDAADAADALSKVLRRDQKVSGHYVECRRQTGGDCDCTWFQDYGTP